MGLLALFRRKPHERAGFELYGAAVAAARAPWCFAELAVPDTMDGRFDLVGLHVSLLIRRLRMDPDRRGPALAQAVFDAMFADMDVTLREMGVSDLRVGKRVRGLWEAFHGRCRAYEAALDGAADSRDTAALAAALRRNVWRAGPGAGATSEVELGAERLASHAMGIAEALADQPLAAFLRGQARFPAPGETARDLGPRDFGDAA
jgi:cytochrome b pre-mRNA-processing protein 3